MPDTPKKIAARALRKAGQKKRILRKAGKAVVDFVSEKKLKMFGGQFEASEKASNIKRRQRVINNANTALARKNITPVKKFHETTKRFAMRDIIKSDIKGLRKLKAKPSGRLTDLIHRLQKGRGLVPKRLIGGSALIPEQLIKKMRDEAAKRGHLKGGKPKS